MLPSYEFFRKTLELVLKNKDEQGYMVFDLYKELYSLPDSYDALNEFARKILRAPLRDEWSYVEPNNLDEIWEECNANRPLDKIGEIDIADISKRVETAFYGSVCGCMLGKPIEEFPFPTLYEIKSALEKANEWPLNDYISEEVLEELGRRNISWDETTKGRINYVAPDDDITYSIIGMLLIEEYGRYFTKEHIKSIWLENLPIYTTWGPERTLLLKSGISSVYPDCSYDMDDWVNVFNPNDERCGALIRADAYGYACSGRPALAAELAWVDASWTHRRTGIYGAMFVAAAIASAPFMKDPLDIFDMALKFVPQNSRFYKIASDSLNEIDKAKDWLDGYKRIHNRYKKYTACQIYQEIGTLMNTLKFAEDIGDGICKQVSQGNDTDSFGATSGSILGAYFGPDYLDKRWVEVFNDDIYTTMSGFRERKLSNIAKRMAKLPQLIDQELALDQ